MITIESIEIIEFRGIRKLQLVFGGDSFAICGPNGTGKSGVVDAVEFALTGNISRLSGEGRGEVSVRAHGPHVDQHDPEKARVRLTLSIVGTNRSATIERSVKSPNAPIVSPRDPVVLAALELIEGHPEFVLSRRELIRYVLATPGNRAQEVQALLRLEQVEKLRAGLQRLANSSEKPLPTLERGVKEARDRLAESLNLDDLSASKLLRAANEDRALLGLHPLAALDDKTSLADGVATISTVQMPRIPKLQALQDVESSTASLSKLQHESTAARISEVVAELHELETDPALAQSARSESFLSIGLELVEITCPFCDTTWDAEELRGLVRHKLEHLKHLTERRIAVERRISELVEIKRALCNNLATLSQYALAAKPAVPAFQSKAVREGFAADCVRLQNLFPLSDSIAILEKWPVLPSEILTEIEGIQRMVQALPDPSKQDAARDRLTRAQERLETYREAMRKQKKGKEAAELARTISNTYAATSDSILRDVYSAVEKDFSLLYGFINKPDEKDFTAKLTPSMGKLGFDVDFYGRGFFPPGAYHSEGHQDGMGLCLYLALMRHLLGDQFRVAVFDDVLMSVDAAHRREVVELLKREFPNTQFIITTHDPIWLRHMRSEGLTPPGRSIQFKSWSVDEGPADWDGRDTWEEIDDHLSENDVRAAAALLRNYLEYIGGELCDNLRAPVGYRGDGRYTLGDLFPAAISRMKALYKRGKNSANSWGKRDVIDRLNLRSDRFDKRAQATKAGEWQINAAVHFNTWDNLHPNDFRPVARSFKEVLAEFRCADCDDLLRVSPPVGEPESLRCRCGEQFNLLEKR